MTGFSDKLPAGVCVAAWFDWSHSDAHTGMPTEAQLVQSYCAQRGLAYPIANWHFYLSFAFFRMACIAQVAMHA